MDSTINSIINVSHLPMSIIIVGVGDEDFSAMERLDADGRKLQLEGRIASRDIVQFVGKLSMLLYSDLFFAKFVCDRADK